MPVCALWSSCSSSDRATHTHRVHGTPEIIYYHNLLLRGWPKPATAESTWVLRPLWAVLPTCWLAPQLKYFSYYEIRISIFVSSVHCLCIAMNLLEEPCYTFSTVLLGICCWQSEHTQLSKPSSFWCLSTRLTPIYFPCLFL